MEDAVGLWVIVYFCVTSANTKDREADNISPVIDQSEILISVPFLYDSQKIFKKNFVVWWDIYVFIVIEIYIPYYSVYTRYIIIMINY